MDESPENLIYDIIIEKKIPPYLRIRAFIKFKHSPGYGYFPTVIGQTAPDGGPLPTAGSTLTQTEIREGVKLLYWAMDNDPEPPAQKILKFFQELNL